MDMWVDNTEEDNHTGGTREKLPTISCILARSYTSHRDCIMVLKLNTHNSDRIHQLAADYLCFNYFSQCILYISGY